MTADIVTIATFQSLPEAEACKLRLEAEGLTVFLTDAETIRTDWLLSNAVGSVKVQVPSAEVASATAILEQVRQRHDAQSSQADQDFCLSCGTVMPQNGSTCPACGWTYATNNDNDEDDDLV